MGWAWRAPGRGRCAARIVLLAALLAGLPLGASLHLERFSPRHGLPHNTVNAILEDRQGFVWLGTDDGLVRYDAYEFETFRFAPALAASTSNKILSLLEDRRGTLWVGTDRGLHRFDRDRDRLEPETAESGLAGGLISVLFEDQRGWIWAGGAGLAVRRGNGRFEAVTTPGGPWSAPDLVGRLVQATDGSLYALRASLVARRSMLLRIDPRGARAEAVPLDAPLPATLCLLQEGPGRLRVDPWTVIDLERGAVELSARRPDPAPILTDCSDGPDHETWFGSDRGIYRRDPRTGSVAREQPSAGDTHWQRNYITSLQAGRGGGLWLGSLGGLYRIDPLARRFEWLGHTPGDPGTLGADSVSALAPDGDELWVGTFGGGLARLGPRGELQSFRRDAARPGSLCDDDVWSLATGRGLLWIGTDSGLCVGDASGTFHRRAVRSLGGLRVKTLDFDDTGTLWLGTDRGLWRLRPREVEATLLRPHLDAPLQAPNVNVVLVEDARRIWVGTSGGDLLRLDGVTGQARNVPLRTTQGDPIPNVGLFDLHPDPNGLIWLASGAGLGRFDPASGRFEMPIAADELPGSIVYAIERDAAGKLWLGTGLGLVRFDPRRPPGQRTDVFDLSDGVGNLEFNRHASLARSGRLYFGGLTGLTSFRPEEIHKNPHPPPVVLTRLGVVGDAGERVSRPADGGAVELGPEDHVVSFGFVALNYTQPTRNRYRYRLEGLDPAWVQTAARSARYTRLPPGSYRFHVQGSNNDGVWNEVGASLRVRVRPPFWRQWWFVSLSGVGLAASAWLAHRLRLRHMVELERMRLRIASDLHDELGSELPGIALATSLVGQRGGLDERDRQRLSDIRAATLRLMQGLRDVVWHLSPEHDSSESMLQRMRATAATLLTGVDYSFEADVAPHGLDMERRRELLLAFKEMLANVVRHAGARQVTIRLALSRQRLRLEVCDDGAGFDPARPAEGAGLASLRRRASRLGAVLDVDSRPGQGARVVLHRQP